MPRSRPAAGGARGRGPGAGAAGPGALLHGPQGHSADGLALRCVARPHPTPSSPLAALSLRSTVCCRSWNNTQYSVIKGDGVKDLRCFPPKGIFEAPCWVPNDQDTNSRTCVVSTEDLRCLTSGRAYGTEVRRAQPPEPAPLPAGLAACRKRPPTEGSQGTGQGPCLAELWGRAAGRALAAACRLPRHSPHPRPLVLTAGRLLRQDVRH
jgi:hypothetical protein